MHLSDRPLVVYPNPFHALDHKGRPSCAVRLDPDVSAGERRYIGATLESTLAEKFHEGNHPGLPMGDGHYDRAWTFKIAPTEIPDTHYHRDRIRDGELVAANKHTLRRALGGGRPMKFIDPLEKLDRERHEAAALWATEQDDEDPPAAKLRLPGDPTPQEPAPEGEAAASDAASEAAPAGAPQLPAHEAIAPAPSSADALPTAEPMPTPDAGAARAMRAGLKAGKTTTEPTPATPSAKAEKPEG